MATSIIHGNTHYTGRLSAQEIGIPDGTVDDDAIAAAAGIAATKQQHQHVLNSVQIVTADTVTAGTFLLHICRGAGEIVNVEVSSAVAPDADTDFFTVDIKIVTAGVGTSILSGATPITYNNTTAKAGDGGDANGNYGIVTGTIDTDNDNFTDNDIIEAVVAVTNGINVNASGLIITVTIRESADEP